MKCMKCGRDTFESANTEAIELDNGCLLVIRNIPCFKCKECSEILYAGNVVQSMERIISQAGTMAMEFVVMDYTSATAA